MSDVMKTVLLNPPSFENFDGGASSRWPATREIESYWYPVWLAYPAGMLEGSRLLDAPPHHVSAEETTKLCTSVRQLTLSAAESLISASLNLPSASRLKRFWEFRTAGMARSFTIPI